MSDKMEVVLLGLAVVFLLVLLGLGPILTLMSLNALFNLGIAYNVYTWLSVAWLNFTTFGGLAMAINRLKNK